MTADQKHWFALYTKPRSEFIAEKQLNSISVLNFLPAITKIRQWSDRKRKVTEPLFRGYIFIYSNEKERLISLELTSIVRCICNDGKPAVIPEWQIDSVKTLLKFETAILVHDGLFPGRKVIIKSGPFKGMIGIVVNSERGKSVAVSIDLLNRSVITRLPDESIVEFI